MKIRLKLLAGLLSLYGMHGTALAQVIEMDQLSQAQSYEPGTLTPGDGALSDALWNSTNATTANSLIEALPERYSHPIARELVRSALLSPGVPPRNDNNSAFANTRIKGIIGLSEYAAAQDVARRTPALSRSSILKADLALLAGDVTRACDISDSVIEDRAQKYWMQIRTFCHVERGEIAAAELMLDLINRDATQIDTGFIALVNGLTGRDNNYEISSPAPKTPLILTLIEKNGMEWNAKELPPSIAAQALFNAALSDDEKLTALFQVDAALSDSQMQEVIRGFVKDDNYTDELAGAAPIASEKNIPDVASLLDDKTARSFAHLYDYSLSGDEQERTVAIIELLKRADEQDGFNRFTKLLEPQLMSLSDFDVAVSDYEVLARAAILHSDISILQNIYKSLEGYEAVQDRVALAADALGNGFYAGNFGSDIDNRLSQKQTRNRAERDAFLAYGLGAYLSDGFIETLQKDQKTIGKINVDLLLLQNAARQNAQAETALRAALYLESKPDVPDFELFVVLDSLYQVGLQKQAAKIAALDFINGMSDLF